MTDNQAKLHYTLYAKYKRQRAPLYAEYKRQRAEIVARSPKEEI